MLNNIDIDFENKRKYEQECYDKGIHCTVIKKILESSEYNFLGYIHRLTDEADYAGVDGYFSYVNPKTHKATILSVDFKFREKNYGDVLYNWVHRNGGPGWARNPKKVNDVVINVVLCDRIAHMTTRKDMISAYDYMNNKRKIATPNGEKNVMMSIEECIEHFPDFVGPIKF